MPRFLVLKSDARARSARHARWPLQVLPLLWAAHPNRWRTQRRSASSIIWGIERNAMAANTAINAVRMAMLGDGSHIVTLDQAIATMKQTGEDMMAKYKETSKGGLAVNVVEC